MKSVWTCSLLNREITRGDDVFQAHRGYIDSELALVTVRRREGSCTSDASITASWLCCRCRWRGHGQMWFSTTARHAARLAEMPFHSQAHCRPMTSYSPFPRPSLPFDFGPWNDILVTPARCHG